MLKRLKSWLKEKACVRDTLRLCTSTFSLHHARPGIYREDGTPADVEALMHIYNIDKQTAEHLAEQYLC